MRLIILRPAFLRRAAARGIKRMQKPLLKIGTRSSALALAQARQVRDSLLSAHNLPAAAVEIVPMSTQGDRAQNIALSALGGKGLFTQEIEAALLAKEIDLAVHSAKDMPAELPAGLTLSTFLKREDPRDAFIGRKVKTLAELPRGAKIGTSSIRRQALLRRLRPDIEIILFRGNVQTRLEKLRAGSVDGTFLAYAGLKRLNLAEAATEILPAHLFIPAPGQGIITVESRIGDAATEALLTPLNDRDTAIAAICERSFMAALDGSCRTPLGAYAELRGETLNLRAIILSPDGKTSHESETKGRVSEAAALGRQAAAELRARAGADFFTAWAGKQD